MAGPVCFSQPWDVGVKGVGVTMAPVCPGLGETEAQRQRGVGGGGFGAGVT